MNSQPLKLAPLHTQRSQKCSLFVEMKLKGTKTSISTLLKYGLTMKVWVAYFCVTVYESTVYEIMFAAKFSCP